MSSVGWVACGYCHAVSDSFPPHGQGQPCPMKVATEAIYVALMEAQTASHNRSGFAMNDMTAMLRKMTGQEEDE